jgi:heme/copper-type cytochrome/quinol oxidase subunit 2
MDPWLYWNGLIIQGAILLVSLFVIGYSCYRINDFREREKEEEEEGNESIGNSFIEWFLKIFMIKKKIS